MAAMKFNWNQTGMPATLVGSLARQDELAEMVRELTTALAQAERELESANRRYERLTADLARRGIVIEESDAGEPERPQRREPKSILEGMDEWEEWDRRFRSLLG